MYNPDGAQNRLYYLEDCILSNLKNTKHPWQCVTHYTICFTSSTGECGHSSSIYFNKPSQVAQCRRRRGMWIWVSSLTKSTYRNEDNRLYVEFSKSQIRAQSYAYKVKHAIEMVPWTTVCDVSLNKYIYWNKRCSLRLSSQTKMMKPNNKYLAARTVVYTSIPSFVWNNVSPNTGKRRTCSCFELRTRLFKANVYLWCGRMTSKCFY